MCIYMNVFNILLRSHWLMSLFVFWEHGVPPPRCYHQCITAIGATVSYRAHWNPSPHHSCPLTPIPSSHLSSAVICLELIWFGFVASFFFLYFCFVSHYSTYDQDRPREGNHSVFLTHLTWYNPFHLHECFCGWPELYGLVSSDFAKSETSWKNFFESHFRICPWLNIRTLSGNGNNNESVALLLTFSPLFLSTPLLHLW